MLGPRAPQDARREKKDRFEKLEHGVDGDSQEAERKKKQPGDGIEHKCEEREGPTENQQDQPQQERRHVFSYENPLPEFRRSRTKSTTSQVR